MKLTRCDKNHATSIDVPLRSGSDLNAENFGSCFHERPPSDFLQVLTDSVLAYVMAALDLDNYSEARS
ncbi:hypothetical protein D9M73_259600 [compost metagenome]